MQTSGVSIDPGGGVVCVSDEAAVDQRGLAPGDQK
jgi:hypothetical protein